MEINLDKIIMGYNDLIKIKLNLLPKKIDYCIKTDVFFTMQDYKRDIGLFNTKEVKYTLEQFKLNGDKIVPELYEKIEKELIKLKRKLESREKEDLDLFK